MSEEKKKLLWISDTPVYPHVGQSRVARECLTRLRNDFDVCVAGFAPDRPPGTETDWDGIHIRNIRRGESHHVYTAIKEFDPDLVVLSHDVFEFPKLPDIKSRFPDKKFIGYFTIDGDPLDTRWLKCFECCDLLWSPTYYGKKTIHDRMFWSKVDVIPYGIDTNKFNALQEADKAAVRKKSRIKLENKFVAFFAGQNCGRKNVATAMEGWRDFADDKHDVIFVVMAHTFAKDMGEWGKIPGEYDLRAYTSPTTFCNTKVISDEELVFHMQTSDVFISPNLGEGVGLPILESMACGCVPVVTNFSGQTDFCKEDNSYLMGPDAHVYSGVWRSRRAIVDQTTVTKTLQQAYEDWKANGPLHIKSQKAILTAMEYSWEKTVKLMKESIDRLYSSKLKKGNRMFEV